MEMLILIVSEFMAIYLVWFVVDNMAYFKS